MKTNKIKKLSIANNPKTPITYKSEQIVTPCHEALVLFAQHVTLLSIYPHIGVPGFFNLDKWHLSTNSCTGVLGLFAIGAVKLLSFVTSLFISPHYDPTKKTTANAVDVPLFSTAYKFRASLDTELSRLSTLGRAAFSQGNSLLARCSRVANSSVGATLASEHG